MRQDEDTGLKSLHGALSLYLQENNFQPFEKSVEAQTKQASPNSPVKSKEASHLPFSQRETGKASITKQWNRILLIALGWMIAGGIGGFAYSSVELGIFDDAGNEIFGGLVGGFIGGLVMMSFMQSMGSDFHRKSLPSLLTSWTLGGALGWLIGFELTEAIGAGIGMVVFVIIGLAGTYGLNFIVSNLGRVAGISAAWFIGEAIGWLIARRWMIDSLDMDHATSWAIGTALAWAIGGFVLGWQVLKDQD
jgi:hypothetical protein